MKNPLHKLELSQVFVHGSQARSWEQVAEYLNGDAHDQSKVQILVNGKFHDGSEIVERILRDES